MKILEENQKQGAITVKIENLNDLWTLYNIISKGDKASARTQRRVILKEGSKGERKPMYLKIEVESISFHEFSNRLRIKGKILEGPEDFVNYGTYHTFNIEPRQKITIFKEKWLKNELRRLKSSSKFEDNFIMLFIAIETGLATLSLITNYSETRITSIKRTIPGKRYEQTHRNRALIEFFEAIKNILEENLKENNINLIVICGPGNTRDQFINYIKEKSNPIYLSKIRSIYASSGTESAILEALKSKKFGQLKKNIKILQESEKIENILTYLSTEADLIAIGFTEILKASEQGAVKELFLVDILIRSSSKEQKLKIEQIITNVENSGGKINILSSEHSTGQRIIDLGSLVAILRYKL
ncbi:MAG: mRNA surveillance protein pelota [Promethearchaeota archaeon]